MNGRKIRIIDTPGFGDTRGIDQDEMNMQHILEYINNLTHVNAVCFLLKPNVSEIHKFFKSCLTQMLAVLGPDVSKNIVFCFTNCRTTFYGPGDTAPLLKKILTSFSEGNIPFNKKSSFCFDNESFRYLVALQKDIQFDNVDRQEYENSWLKSANESERLFSYIGTELSTSHKPSKCQSIKNAQLKITHMIRPMLEAIRNILRNKILYDMNVSNASIVLSPKALDYPATLCLKCERNLIKKGKFWIARAPPHKIQKVCHSCGSNEHMSIDYDLCYQSSDKPPNDNRKQLEEGVNLLRDVSVQFAHFLKYSARSSKDDPFLMFINQMMDEEDDICRSRKSNEMNRKLSKELMALMNEYVQTIDGMELTQKYIEPPAIYKLIESVSNHHMVQIQMTAVKKTQEKLMKLYEYIVREHLTN